jgi:O-antigen ligase
MLGVLIAFIVLIFFFNRSERRALWRITPLFFVLIVASMVLLNAGEFVKRFDAVSDPSSEGSTAYRVFELYNVSQMIREKPIFGWPMGITYKNYTVLDLPPISSVVTHDVYVYVLWRSGIIGLFFWIVMLTAIIRMHFRTIRAARTPFERFTAFWLATSSLLVVVSGFFTPVAADHLQLLYPFLLVMASYLPGAWSQRMLNRLPRNLGCISVEAPTS